MRAKIINQARIKRNNKRLLITKTQFPNGDIGFLIESKVLIPNTRKIERKDIYLSNESIHNIILACLTLGIEKLIDPEEVNIKFFGPIGRITTSFSILADSESYEEIKERK